MHEIEMASQLSELEHLVKLYEAELRARGLAHVVDRARRDWYAD